MLLPPIRRLGRLIRWHFDTATGPAWLAALGRRRRELAALAGLGLFAFVVSTLVTAAAIVDPQALQGWALVAVLICAAFLAAWVGHVLVELAGMAAATVVNLVRRGRHECGRTSS